MAACALVPAAAMADLAVSYGGLAVAGQGLKTLVDGAVVDTFTAPRPTWTWTNILGSGAITSGSVSGVKAAPAGDTSEYFCLPGPSSGFTKATVDVDFGSAYNYLGLYWGSIDSYNSVTFYNGSLVVASFTGTQISPGATGDHFDDDSNKYVNFSGAMFDRVRFSSDSIAFEFDNLAVAVVPVPGAVLLGFLGLGVAGLKLRKYA